ncbi:MAG TPA: HD domain-containing protein [Micromonosporaceae bacterium]|nr:HD domain-containing protein [Micromonosporaceae bacterium]
MDGADGSDIVGAARTTAERLLADAMPRRWRHVYAVGHKAQRIAPAFSPTDAATLVAAAWLHDIGYATDLVDTGFHPLDGARWLRARGADARVTVLVANHSCALIEAAERGLGAMLADEFPLERSATADALVYCDLTTGPDGRSLSVEDRLSEIRTRYGTGSVVARFVDRAEEDLVSAVRRTQRRLGTRGLSEPT